MKLPELNEILQYQNSDVLARYKQDYPNNALSSEQTFKEILKFLWLSQKHRQAQFEQPNNEELQFPFLLHVEMKEIDDMWHTFILFTKAYTDFCEHYFGEYLHHYPTTEAEKSKNLENLDDFINKDTQRMLSFTYDHLGEATLRVWFSAYFSETK